MNKKRIIRIIIIITFLLLVGILGTLYEKNEIFTQYLDKYIFQKEKHENNLPKILMEYDNTTYVYTYKNNIAVLKNNKLEVYNHYGNKEHSLDIEISNPIFSTSDSYLAIAEKNGKKIYVIYDYNLVWQKNLEEEITNLKINSEGYLLVATTGTIHKQVIQTFDNKGNELFRDFVSSTYIIDMDISPDSKYVALAQVNYSGILVQSSIKIISIEKTKTSPAESVIYNKTSEDGDLIINIKYQDKNTLMAIYDKFIETIAEENVNTLDYSQEDVLFVDFSNKFIKIINKDSKVYLQVFNKDLNSLKEYEVQEPKSICVSNGVIALNLGNKVYFYSNSSWLIKKYYADQEINKIVLCDNVAGIVYNDKIELVSL